MATKSKSKETPREYDAHALFPNDTHSVSQSRSPINISLTGDKSPFRSYDQNDENLPHELSYMVRRKNRPQAKPLE